MTIIVEYDILLNTIIYMTIRSVALRHFNNIMNTLMQNSRHYYFDFCLFFGGFSGGFREFFVFFVLLQVRQIEC